MKSSAVLRWVRGLALVFFWAPACLYAQTNVLTYHNDNARTGQNVNETTLTPGNVNSFQFGKLSSVALDGYVYAQPLVVTNVAIPNQGTHNVVYVATENDSLYAIDADNGSELWQVSLVNPSAGVTAVPGTATACGNIAPTLGITGTPVIDSTTGTLYLVAFTEENGTYVQRLHAIDIATHAEKFGGPVVIQATVPGTGSGSVNGSLSFDPFHSNQRAGLLLQNGAVIIAWGSYCDHAPYHGWVMSYNAGTLAQQAALNTTPNGSGGGVWAGGAGPAADGNSNIYLSTGNGDYDASAEWGDSILKLTGPSSGSFTVADWFTPYDQATLDTNDWDLGAGGVLLLPDLPSGSPHQQLLVQASKKGTIVLVDRNNLGQFCSNCTSTSGDTQIVQEIPGAVTGLWGMPAYWNGNVYFGGAFYYGGSGDNLKAFSFNANNSGVLSSSPTSESTEVFSFSGPTPSVSASGNTNGIVWALENGTHASSCCQVLHAYDATNLATEFYNTNQAPNSRDVPGGAVKFTVPTVANGKVYVGSQASLSIYGLLPAAATPVFSPSGGTYNAAQSVTITDSSAGTTIYYTTDGSAPTTSSTVYTGPVSVSTTTTINAVAAGGAFTPSAVASATYTIQAAAATPTFNPVAGTYSSAQSVTISDTSTGTTIYYTINGTTPTTASTVYTGPISVSATTTIKAIAAGGSFFASAVGTATYAIQSAAATPTFSPVAGTYSSTQSVTISDTSTGTTIYYTTNGTTPTTASTVYTVPISVSATTTIKAIAAGGSFSASAVASATYTIQSAAATPTFSPVAGTYSSTQSVSISDTSTGTSIYYTTNGTTPTTASTVYTGPISVSATTTIKAIAAGGSFSASAVGSATYTIQTAAATPAFSPVAGTYSSTQSVSISDTSTGTSIYYTTNGTTPTTASTVYTGPISVSATTTIKAIAAGGSFSASAVASATYTIQAAAATPTFSPAAGAYHSTQSVTLSDSSPGVSIHYTTNGSTPTASSTVYTGPISVSTTTTIKAIAAGGSFSASAVGSATYTLTAATPTFSPVAGTYHSAQSVTLSDSSPGVTIHYTTNGSTPTTASTAYTGPIAVTTTTTIKAIAAGGSLSASAVGSATYTLTAATPTFGLASGTYHAVHSVTISDSSPGVTIHYTTNGTTPTTSSTVYTGAITVSTTTTIKALGVGGGFAAGAVGSATYTLTAATPTFKPVAGTYHAVQSVTIADGTPGVTLHYTTNGTTPTTSSAVYTGAIRVSTTTTIKAMAIGGGFAAGAVGTATYTLTAATPTFSPVAGTYSSAQSVTISDSSPGVTIHYTTNGTTPTTASAVYTGAVRVSTTTTLKALAVGGGFAAGAVGSATYTIP